MSTLTIDGFLLARVTEDEKPCVCLERGAGACGGPWCRDDCRVCSCGDAYTDNERVLVESEAKREVIAECRAAIEREVAAGRGGTSALWGVCVNILRHMTLPYTDHPDFDEEWRV